MTDMQPRELYDDTRDRVIDLVRPLNTQQSQQIVPLTPGWNIAAVLAHLCGLAADVAAGGREGLGTDERTACQVSSRAGRGIDVVCEEWIGYTQAMHVAIAEDGFLGSRLSADLVVHLHDLQHALGVMIDQNDEATISGGRTYAARTPDRLAEATNIGLVIELNGDSRFEPASDSGPFSANLLLRATPYDFLRSVTGRRSRGEVKALAWSADPSALLDQFSPYGPLRAIPAGI